MLIILWGKLFCYSWPEPDDIHFILSIYLDRPDGNLLKDDFNDSHTELAIKSIEIYEKCNNKDLIFDILDDHYKVYDNIVFISNLSNFLLL